MDIAYEDPSPQQQQLPQEQQELQPQCSSVSLNDDQRVYFVPYRWWKEAHDSSSSFDSDGKKGVLYAASPASSYGPMKIINNFFNSELIFNLRREDDSSSNHENGEVGVSGRDYAMISGEMWLQALKWHSDSKASTKNGKSFSAAEDDMADVYPLHLRLSASRENNSFGVKISKKDNTAERYRRACKIFTIDSQQLRIWDFSGRTSLFIANEKNGIIKESLRQTEQEIPLDLQIYGLSDLVRNREVKKDERASQHFGGSSVLMNGISCNGNYSFLWSKTSASAVNIYEAGPLGLTGLQNLGNTCFMNSALQCLAHTPRLADYFLGDYSKEINHENPLGMDGEIASAFGDLLRKLWAPGATTVEPRTFKSKLARFAPQFSGFNQHDSQEFLAFLLDGLHEDLNCVKCKPYVEANDSDGRPDEEVADEYWKNHLARNDSVIVDVCQGQYRSTLVCPHCKKVSVTFDPFMYLSLPLPSMTMRTMTLTVVGTDKSDPPSPFIVTVPENGKFEDLIHALSIACSLADDEVLLVAEIYGNRIIHFLEEPTDLLSLIRNADQLVAYRLNKDFESGKLVVFMHQRMEEHYISGKLTSTWKTFGIPLVGSCKIVNGSDLSDLYLKLLEPFLIPCKDSLDNSNSFERNANEDTTEIEVTTSSSLYKSADGAEKGVIDIYSKTKLQFYLNDDKGVASDTEIVMNEPIRPAASTGRLSVLVRWPDKMIYQYSTQLYSTLPEVFKFTDFSKEPQESVSLYKCLEAFIKEEPLGPDDMWYCPSCKKHRQASKKLDLWRLPEILVVHLKRFSYSRILRNKLEAYVDFPIHDLDLSTYIANKSGESCNRYMLYAISNHYGSMGGGHYTAFVHHGGDRWYEFDDSRVSSISEKKLKTSAAYVLFYRRS